MLLLRARTTSPALPASVPVSCITRETAAARTGRQLDRASFTWAYGTTHSCQI